MDSAEAAALQSQLDDIKSAIFVLVDKLASVSGQLDSSVSQLNLLAARMRESQKQTGGAEAHYPQVQERLNAIAAIEKELLEQVKANAQLVTLIGRQQDELRRKEDELAAAMRVVAHQLATLTQEVQSPDRTAQVTVELARVSKAFEELKTDGNAAQGDGMRQALALVAQELAGVSKKIGEGRQPPAAPEAATAGGEGVAIALTLMAQKLDEYVQQQKRAGELVLQEIAGLKEKLSPQAQAPPAELDAEAFLRKDALVQPQESEAAQEDEIPPERVSGLSEPDLPEPPRKQV